MAEYLDTPRVRMLRIDRWGRPLRAEILTKYGRVRVRWRNIDGHWTWTSSSSLQAVIEAEVAIEYAYTLASFMA